MKTYYYTEVEQNTRALLQSLQQNQGPPLYKLSPQQARAVLSDLQAGHIKKLSAEIENRITLGGQVGEISIQIVRPSDSSNETLPVVMYFHDGGWVLGAADTHVRLLRELANGAPCCYCLC